MLGYRQVQGRPVCEQCCPAIRSAYRNRSMPEDPPRPRWQTPESKSGEGEPTLDRIRFMDDAPTCGTKAALKAERGSRGNANTALVCYLPVAQGRQVWPRSRLAPGPAGQRYMLFLVLNIFTRQWLAYRFGTLATTDVAIESLTEAVVAAKLHCSRLTLQCDNGSQYAGKRFQKAASLLGIHPSFIRTRTSDKTVTWNYSTALPRDSMSGRTTLPTTSRRRPSYQKFFGTATRTDCTRRSSTSSRASFWHHGR